MDGWPKLTFFLFVLCLFVGCFTYPRGMPDCDFDINTYECKACYTDNFSYMRTVDWDDDDMTDFGACMTWIRGAYDEVDRTFDV